MPEQRTEVLDALKQEMTAAWAYLHAYAELFDHSDPRRMQLLEETTPGFFALVQTALIECVLFRLARLMDPQESGRNNVNQNLSFGRLFCPCSDPSGLADAAAQFGEVCKDWHGERFRSLKEHRNKVQAHNDFPTIKGAIPLVTTKLTGDDVKLLNELFRRLWMILKTAHHLLKGTTLIEPRHKALNQLPQAIFPYLSSGLYMEMTLASRPETFNDFAEFKYTNVGRDSVMSIVDR